MRRKSRVADTLKQICADISLSSIQEGYEGVSAQQLSEFMGMDRANVSKELNQLFQEDAVIKITGRPVYYFDRDRMEELLAHPLDTCTVPSLQDFLQGHRQDTENDFDKLIGSDKSLK
ncbi:MAG: transcriptional regulator, partial [Clostridium sp.]